ncbi:MAG: hypothetical protein GF308_17555 [Candidatus Heimdallarchaeota archaeon]|nr:hypothetical protein [Candidatus Heimdallarchaeota archaeon]
MSEINPDSQDKHLQEKNRQDEKKSSTGALKIEEEVFVDPPEQSFWVKYNINWLTISLAVLGIVLVILGVIFFYRIEAISPTIGFWLSVAGVLLFLFTVIFGFERIRLSD